MLMEFRFASPERFIPYASRVASALMIETCSTIAWATINDRTDHRDVSGDLTAHQRIPHSVEGQLRGDQKWPDHPRFERLSEN